MKNIKNILTVSALATATVLSSCAGGGAPTTVQMNNHVDSVSYAMGVVLGMDMRESIEQRFEPSFEGFNRDNFIAGFYTLLKDSASLKMDPMSANDFFMAAMQAAQQKQEAILQAKRDSAAAVNLEKGKKFLEENAKKEGVVTLPSGIQYIVLEDSKGKKPTIDDQVECDYVGTLIDGTEFDSSIKRGQPATFPLANVIKGWQEVIPMMSVGSKWKIFIPAELAYGTQDRPGIPGNSVLIFEVKLHQIIKNKKK